MQHELGAEMRQLVQSRAVIGLLIALYLCASLAAIPVPRFVADTMARVGLTIDSADGAGNAHDANCSCGDACSAGGSCCCAAAALTKEPEFTDTDRDGLVLMSINCSPPLKWFLAAVPPVFTRDLRQLFDSSNEGELIAVFETEVLSVTTLEVPAPPPRLAC